MSYSKQAEAASKAESATNTESASKTETAVKVKPESPGTKVFEESKTDKIYVYIGPSIRGVVNNGRIFKGSIDGIKKELEAAAKVNGIEDKMPKIERLLIQDKNLSAAKQKLSEGGVLSEAFKAIKGE